MIFKDPIMPEWEILQQPARYQSYMTLMHSHVENMISGSAGPKIILLEHEPVYTSGITNSNFPISCVPFVKTTRGGLMTYHGEGQRIIYPMLDLNHYKRDILWYINTLEEWVITSLKIFGINGHQNTNHRGVWVKVQDRDTKIASIGIRIRKWITFHGVSINVSTNLKYFNEIVPCGIQGVQISSCHSLGYYITMQDLDNALISTFKECFRIDK